MEKFLPVDEENNYFKQFATTFKVLFRVFSLMVFIALISTILKPFYTNDSLPMEIWIPKKNENYFYYLIYFFETYFFFYSCFSIVGFDVLFEAFCIAIILQFQILKQKFSEMDFKNWKSTKYSEKIFFVGYIRHQIFLTQYVLINIQSKHFYYIIHLFTALNVNFTRFHRFVQRLSKIYSNFFLFQIFSTIMLFSIEIVPLLLEPFNFIVFFRSTVMFLAIVCQFSFYCIPAAEITQKVSST